MTPFVAAGASFARRARRRWGRHRDRPGDARGHVRTASHDRLQPPDEHATGPDQPAQRHPVLGRGEDPDDREPGGMVLAPGQVALVPRHDGHGVATGDAGRGDPVRPRVELAGRRQHEHEVLRAPTRPARARPGARPRAPRPPSRLVAHAMSLAIEPGRAVRLDRPLPRPTRGVRRRPVRRRQSIERFARERRVDAHQDGGRRVALGRLEPFGRAAQHETRRAEPRGLALDPARIGQHRRGVELGGQRAAVAERLDDDDVRARRRRRAPRSRRASPDAGRARPADRHGPARPAPRPSRGSRPADGSPPDGPSRTGTRPSAARRRPRPPAPTACAPRPGSARPGRA